MTAEDKRIVVGVDDGSDSAIALRWAAHAAVTLGRPLTLVYAQFDPYSTIPADAAIPPAVDLGSPPLDADQVLADAVEAVHTCAPSVDILTYTEAGNPARLLLEQAKDASLVVLGNRGASVLSELLLGTVCGTVAARAPCPVIAVCGSRERPCSGESRRDAPIVVGVDGSGIAEQAVEFAFSLASAQEAPLHVERVLRHPDPDAQLDTEARLIPLTLRYPDVRLRVRCTEGDPVRTLTTAAADAQLLVVGARGHGAAAGLLTGSVSHALLRRAPCSVAVVRKGCAMAALA